MARPNFLIIGAIKGGTTSLHEYLRQHPDVFMPERKELGYFAFDESRPADEGLNRYVVRDVGEYLAHFAGSSGHRAIGEASPQYLWSPIAPARIRELLLHARLVAVLRDPVDRAYSAYLHLVREGAEICPTFEQAWEEEPKRIAARLGPLWRYTEVGFYAAQLERYFALFPRERILIRLFDDLQADAAALVRDVFRFLTVDDTFQPNVGARLNPSGVPRSRRLQSWLRGRSAVVSAAAKLIPAGPRRRLARAVERRNLEKPALAPQTRERLIALFREDILRTQDLIQRDLSAWLRV